MTLFLAAYDPAVESDSGNYWAWAHPNISRRLLDKLYYDVLARRRPDDPNALGKEDVVGGCATVDETWCFWYRFFNGDRDSRGRPGRFVVVVAVLRPTDLEGRDWTGFLTSPLFQEIEETAQIYPVPAPPSLETSWDRPEVIPSHDLLTLMDGKTTISLSTDEIGQAISLLARANSDSFHLEIDWSKEPARTQLTLQKPIQCLPEDLRKQIPSPRSGGRIVKNELTAAPTKGDNKRASANFDGDQIRNRWQGRVITLLAIAVVLLIILLAIVLLSRGPENPPTLPSIPSIPDEPVLPRAEPRRSDAQIPIEDKIVTYVYYHQILCNKDGPTTKQIHEFFSLTDGQEEQKLNGLVKRHKLVRDQAFPLGSERYRVNRDNILPAEIERLPHLVQTE